MKRVKSRNLKKLIASIYYAALITVSVVLVTFSCWPWLIPPWITSISEVTWGIVVFVNALIFIYFMGSTSFKTDKKARN